MLNDGAAKEGNECDKGSAVLYRLGDDTTTVTLVEGLQGDDLRRVLARVITVSLEISVYDLQSLGVFAIGGNGARPY